MDTQEFTLLRRNPWKQGIVAWYQRGDVLELYVGPKANALGTVKGEYRGKPALFTDANIDASIDIAPENNPLLIAELVPMYMGIVKPVNSETVKSEE
jgi:hypothetical protein